MKLLAPALAIILYCAVSSLPLFQAWWDSPFEKLSWIAFLVWIAPLLIHRAQTPSWICLAGALLATLLGTIGSLNTLKYLGLSLSLASFAPMGWAFPLWLLASITWMPLFGWLSAHFFSGFAIPFKLGLVFIASAALSLQNGDTR